MAEEVKENAAIRILKRRREECSRSLDMAEAAVLSAHSRAGEAIENVAGWRRELSEIDAALAALEAGGSNV
jgi:hypothetical protein